MYTADCYSSDEPFPGYPRSLLDFIKTHLCITDILSCILLSALLTGIMVETSLDICVTGIILIIMIIPIPVVLEARNVVNTPIS